jgi:hypothetical protein
MSRCKNYNGSFYLLPEKSVTKSISLLSCFVVFTMVLSIYVFLYLLYPILLKRLLSSIKGVTFPPVAHRQQESVVSILLWSMVKGGVFCHWVKAGEQGKYPPLVGLSLHCPKGIILVFACLSASVAVSFPAVL